MNKLIVSTSAAAGSSSEEGGPEPTSKALKTTANYTGSVYGTYTSTWEIGAAITPSLPNGNYSFDNGDDIETYRVSSNTVAMTGTAAFSGGTITYYDDCNDYYTETDPSSIYGRIAGADTIYTNTVWGFLDERLDGIVELAPYSGVFDEGIQVGVFDRICPSKSFLYPSCYDANLDTNFVNNAYYDGDWLPSLWESESMADGETVQIFTDDGMINPADPGEFFVYDFETSQTFAIELDADGFLIAIAECIPPNAHDIWETPLGMLMNDEEALTKVYLDPEDGFFPGNVIYKDPALTDPYDLGPYVYIDNLSYPVSVEGVIGSSSPLNLVRYVGLFDGCNGDAGPTLYMAQVGSEPASGDSVYSNVDFSDPASWVDFDGMFVYAGWQYTVNSGVIGVGTECAGGGS